MNRTILLVLIACGAVAAPLRADVELTHKWVWCMHNLRTPHASPGRSQKTASSVHSGRGGASPLQSGDRHRGGDHE